MSKHNITQSIYTQFITLKSSTILSFRQIYSVYKKTSIRYFIIITSNKQNNHVKIIYRSQFTKKSRATCLWQPNAKLIYTKTWLLNIKSFPILFSNFYFFALYIKYAILDRSNNIFNHTNITFDNFTISQLFSIFLNSFIFGPKIFSGHLTNISSLYIKYPSSNFSIRNKSPIFHSLKYKQNVDQYFVPINLINLL